MDAPARRGIDVPEWKRQATESRKVLRDLKTPNELSRINAKPLPGECVESRLLVSHELAGDTFGRRFLKPLCLVDDRQLVLVGLGYAACSEPFRRQPENEPSQGSACCK